MVNDSYEKMMKKKFLNHLYSVHKKPKNRLLILEFFWGVF